jgi:hypothetical protein
MSAAILLSLALLVWQAIPADAPVEGSVVRRGTDEPVRGARILLTKVDGQLSDSRTAFADNTGQFAVRSVRAGTYRLFADADGYIRADYDQLITVGSGQQAHNIRVTMTPSGVIVGRMLNGSSDPLPNLVVRALKPSYPQGERTLVSVAQTKTNDLGEYRLWGLKPGLYFLSAAPYDPPRIEGQTYVVPTPPCRDCRGEGQAIIPLPRMLAAGDFLDPGAVEGAVHLPVYFPGTADPTAARPIHLEAGSTFNAGDLIMVRTRGVRVRGRVIHYRTGQIVAGVSMQLDARPRISGSSALRSIYPDSSDAGGFEIPGLVPGSYALTARFETNLVASVAVDVRESDIDSLDIVLRPLFKINGRLRGGDATGMAQARIVLQSQISPVVIHTSALQPDGSFTISNVAAGYYRIVLTGAPKNWYVKTVQLSASDVLDKIVYLEDEPKTPLEVVVSRNAPTLDALVRDDQQRAVRRATVVLVSASGLSFTGNTDDSGRTCIESIVPGAYRVFAADRGDAEDAWQDPDVLRLYEKRGQEIFFLEGGNYSIELNLTRN